MSVMPSPKSMMSESRAPFVFFEHVPAMSCRHGVFCMSLAAGRPLAMNDGSLMNELVFVGQIQATREAMLELRVAIDRILAVPAPGKAPSSDTDDGLWRH